MTITSQDVILTLMGEFVELRKTGYDRDDAWHQIEPKARHLTPRDLERLYSLLRNWEAKEGRQYKPRRNSSDPHMTQKHDAEQVAQVQQESRLKSLIRPLVQKTSLLSRPATTCPVCGRENPSREVVCLGCGQVLVGNQRVQKAGSTRPMVEQQSSTSYFGPDTKLYLRLPEVQEPLSMYVGEGGEVVIGRVVEGSVMIPDIDLTPYQGEHFGVSRLHASLRRMGETLVITDLDSLNHTHVNGQLLHPHEVRVLNDGDEIRLGWMPIRVYFKHDQV